MFHFMNCTKIIAGEGTIQYLPAEAQKLSIQRLLIVTDSFFAESKVVAELIDQLKKVEIETFLFTKVVPNPRDIDCELGAEYANEKGVQGIVAIGGGSAMDEAKAIAAIAANGGTCRIWDNVPLHKKMLPTICIPTTVGTGSEVTFVSVITDTKRHFKMSLFDENNLVPSLAILDPILTKTLPEITLASTAIDALTHAVEAYTSIKSQPFSDALAMYAVGEIYLNLPLVTESENLENRSRLMYASTMAGAAFINSNVGAVHALSETVGAIYDIPHGIANSIFLGDIMEYNLDSCYEKYAELAVRMVPSIITMPRKEQAHQSIELIKKLIKKMNIPKLKDFSQVRVEDFDAIAQEAVNNELSLDNPKRMTKAAYKEVLEKAYAYDE